LPVIVPAEATMYVVNQPLPPLPCRLTTVPLIKDAGRCVGVTEVMNVLYILTAAR
jgi:hypothetical protein